MNVVSPVSQFPFMGYFSSPAKHKDYQKTSSRSGRTKDRKTKKIETEVLLSLSYLPTAERLSVVVMKAKNIEIKSEETITKNKTTVPNPFVKVCLIYAGRKIKKKKTSVRRQEKNPVYNESMIFDVPANFLHKIGFLITIEHKNFENEQTTVLGRVVIGSPVHNNALRHWNQMLAFPRRPVAAWHKVFHLG
ncbi:synaptotagmin-12 isoform X2 [Paramuricea clavata]|uniref:Synaptotagmin-12 isoform X2 n=1 Tax=Paramuricea clavata TaxID=317549 RepID=A0A6S7IDV6_PARCT|nr:synaptotagmin-12 isoform X2 [Paramuricea clavata]